MVFKSKRLDRNPQRLSVSRGEVWDLSSVTSLIVGGKEREPAQGMEKKMASDLGRSISVMS